MSQGRRRGGDKTKWQNPPHLDGGRALRSRIICQADPTALGIASGSAKPRGFCALSIPLPAFYANPPSPNSVRWGCAPAMRFLPLRFTPLRFTSLRDDSLSRKGYRAHDHLAVCTDVQVIAQVLTTAHLCGKINMSTGADGAKVLTGTVSGPPAFRFIVGR
jgi:hypothetical protein